MYNGLCHHHGGTPQPVETMNKAQLKKHRAKLRDRSKKIIDSDLKAAFVVVFDDRKMGRQTDYSVLMDELAKSYSALGASDFEIADALNISATTLLSWKSLHTSFRASMTAGEELWNLAIDSRIKRAIATRATGYEHDSEVIHVSPMGRVTRVPTKVHVPADVKAGQYWLNNRKRDEFQSDGKGAGGGVNISIQQIIAAPQTAQEATNTFVDSLKITDQAFAHAAIEAMDAEFEEVKPDSADGSEPK